MKSGLVYLAFVIWVIGLCGCSTFSRKNASQEDAKPATPLDMPKDKNSESATAEPQPAPPAEANDPSVTLVRKDGTVVTPAAATEAPAMTAEAVAAAEKQKLAQEAQVGAPGSASSEWGYDGENGSEHWGDLKSEYATCRDGKMQSPVDLKWHKPSKGAPVVISYKPVKAKVSDNGHTIELAFDAGSVIKIKGHDYDLMTAHFHSGSEHSLSGKQFPLEMHLVHKDAAGKLAVLAVFLADGKANPVIQKIWTAIPSDKSSPPSEITIQPKDLIPASNTYYMYEGSLTTPPCSEGVEWIVFNNPLHVSEGQVSAFRIHYPKNARGSQPLNGRKVVNY